MSRPLKAMLINMWLSIPPGAPHPKQTATLHAQLVSKPGQTIAVTFDPEEAATLGRRLLDFAGRADVVTAVSAVGTVMQQDRR